MKTTLQVPIDKKLKIDSEKAAQNFGFSSLQELVRFFLRQVSSGKIAPSFSATDEFLTPEQEAILTEKYLEAKEEIAKGKGYESRDIKKLMKILDFDGN